MASEHELAEFDRAWWQHEAARAFSIDGALDYGAADGVRRITGLGMSETIATLSTANDGEYPGTPEGGRALLSALGLLQKRAEHKGIDLGEAAVELAGTSTEEGSERIADLAERYAEKHEVDYFDALIAVQKGEQA